MNSLLNIDNLMDIDNNDYFLDDNFDDLMKDINDIFLNFKPFDSLQFIINFPKYIFFLKKIDIFKFFLDKNYSFYSINWIAYNQSYLCSLILHPKFDDFLELLFNKFKENILFYTEDDILEFITNSKYNFRDYILNCNIFLEEIEIENFNLNLNLNYENIILNSGMEEVD